MPTSETRARIIRAAEVLFAREGYASTSLREITERAGVNVAAVNYHFGSKEDLLVEILDRIIGPLNDERMDLLDEVESGCSPGASEVLTAFLLPDLRLYGDLRSRDPELPRFVARMYSENSDLMLGVTGRQFAEVQERFSEAFRSALPGLPTEEILWRLQCVVGIVLYLFAGVEVEGTVPMLGDDTEENLSRLLSVTVPMMEAPRDAVADVR